MLPAVLALCLTVTPAVEARRTAVVAITNAAAEIPAEPRSFAAAVEDQVERLADHWLLRVDRARRSPTCNLETFTDLGFDPALCGATRLPADIERIIVFELDVVRGHSSVRAAYFDPRRPRAGRRVAESVGDETRASAVQRAFARLFGAYGRVRFEGGGDGYVFIDGRWLPEVPRGDVLLAPGRHVVEIRRSASIEHVADLAVVASQQTVVELGRSRALARR